MGFTTTAIEVGERVPWPDIMTRYGIAMLVGRTRRRLARMGNDGDQGFATRMSNAPIALNTGEANAQHYELPAAFFALFLGPRRKYSCCFYDDPECSLAEAEELALAETAARAGLGDGMRILELGCGWGSLSLWMAAAYPSARITSVSNSHSQRAHIVSEAGRRGLANLEVITADMNDFDTPGRFDRVISIEMFEHMSNWTALLERISGWLKPDGRLFVHVFAHSDVPYRFDTANRADWIARHFFTGGIMPSHGLIGRASPRFEVEADWRWSGSHYARTAEHWIGNFDREREAIDRILRDIYGADAALWRRRWRLFLLATAGLFGHQGGDIWGVSHYRLKPRH